MSLIYRSECSSAKFSLSDYKSFKLDSTPANETECSRDDALRYLESLHRIRRMETALGNMYKEKLIRGFCHLYSGQVSFNFDRTSMFLLLGSCYYSLNGFTYFMACLVRHLDV